ncbi:hypothetical protein FB45DRAFT_963182 [Roridomyces roridus]|uniref:Aminoglycoside phosphotransferase domain-containing protein n=1 Tax=Roridomyces roridus TaxID=1738132 RepID=A0AAD7AY64_9AGAR|nr:hypothetical protein FB45DRAFT_963182 [Roridomyces roridus]
MSSDSTSHPEEQEPSWPVPDVKKMAERIDSFFSKDDVKCRRGRFTHHGGNHSIIEMDVGTPGSERVFIARVDFAFCIGTDRLRRVPWKLSSEVATMRYLKANTTIAIPEIYFYDEDLDNEVGGPWMLMEFIEGRRIEQALSEMSMQQMRPLSESIADYWNQLLSLRFDAIGSLSYDNKGDIVVGPLSMMCPQIISVDAPPPRDKCGPFATVPEWILAVANSDLRYEIKPEFRKSPEEEEAVAHLVAGNLATLKAESFLWKGARAHPLGLKPPDFRLHNVLVSPTDPTKVLAVIDWEGTRTAPIWDIFKLPSFWDYDHPSVLRQEREELNRMIWFKVAQLNPEWADAMAVGGSLRNASLLARIIDWEAENYTLEIPGSFLPNRPAPVYFQVLQLIRPLNSSQTRQRC